LRTRRQSRRRPPSGESVAEVTEQIERDAAAIRAQIATMEQAAVPGHPVALMLPRLLAGTARHVRGIGPMFEVVPAGCRQKVLLVGASAVPVVGIGIVLTSIPDVIARSSILSGLFPAAALIA
jgi:hypothetical protein